MSDTPPEQQLHDIAAPHAHDVLCGRGGGTNNHIGNTHWRMLVAANKELYVTLPKRQKILLSRSIVNAVRCQNPPGRFLQKDEKANTWFDVGDQKAQEKTSQALREGAKETRKKVEQKTGETVDVDFSERPPPVSSSSSTRNPEASTSESPVLPPPVATGGASYPVEPSSPQEMPPPPLPQEVPSFSAVPEDQLAPLNSDVYPDEVADIPTEMVSGGLEPPGASLGTVSMGSIMLDGAGMSLGSTLGPADLEKIGISMGSAMSTTNIPDAPDGGIEPYPGVSMGSMMSFTSTDRRHLQEALGGGEHYHHALLEQTRAAQGGGEHYHHALLEQTRATGNLLYDSDDDDSDSELDRRRNRSEEYKKLQATLNIHDQNNAFSTDDAYRVAPGLTTGGDALGGALFDGKELERNITSTTLDPTELEYAISGLSLDEQVSGFSFTTKSAARRDSHKSNDDSEGDKGFKIASV